MAFRQTDAEVDGERSALPPGPPALYQEAEFRPVCQGKNRFVTKFNAFLRRFAVIFALLVLGFAGQAVAQSAMQGQPDGRPRRRAAGRTRWPEEARSTLSNRVSTAWSDDDAKLVEIRLAVRRCRRVPCCRAASRFGRGWPRSRPSWRNSGRRPRKASRQSPRSSPTNGTALIAEKAEINAVLGMAENLSVRVNGLIDRIAELRRELFARLLTHRYDLDYALLGDVAEAFYSEGEKLRRTVSSWLRFVVQFKLNSLLAAAFFALCAAVPAARRAAALRQADPARPGGGIADRTSSRLCGRLLVDADAVPGRGRLSRRDLFLLQFLQRAARRHRRDDARAVLCHRSRFLRDAACPCGAVAQLAGLAAGAGRIRGGALAVLADRGDGDRQRARLPAELHLRRDGLAAVADGGGEPDRHRDRRHSRHAVRLHQAVPQRRWHTKALAALGQVLFPRVSVL